MLCKKKKKKRGGRNINYLNWSYRVYQKLCSYTSVELHRGSFTPLRRAQVLGVALPCKLYAVVCSTEGEGQLNHGNRTSLQSSLTLIKYFSVQSSLFFLVKLPPWNWERYSSAESAAIRQLIPGYMECYFWPLLHNIVQQYKAELWGVTR